MSYYLETLKSVGKYLLAFFRWIVISIIIGLAGGVVGAMFSMAVSYVTGMRLSHENLLYFLPVGGILIILVYKLFKISQSMGTNTVLISVRTQEHVPFLMAPSIFISTVITHLFGGSAGREGAALQLGGSIGDAIGELFKLDEKDMHIVTLCGMSAVFSALFSTPLTAAFFAMEVVSVGIIYYSGLIPCLASSLTAYGVAKLLKAPSEEFAVKIIPRLNAQNIGRIVVLAALCALVSIIFCIVMHKTAHLFSKIFTNEYIRIVVGGAIIIVLSLIFGRDCCGAGTQIIEKAFEGHTSPTLFILKIIFTAVTIGSGYKGGEIVPTMFIGATFGSFAGHFLGLSPDFAAAVGLVAMFCSVVNCPVASIFLSIELFGSQGLLLFAAAVGVSYMLSGYYGLYSSQKIMYSKLRAEYININAK